ncbi:MAG: hypothetical protein OEY44_01255 [Candidatus Peregrinibacteria bacterium]|nr:hypothetical protein [Candidatus Peregrinibacteria bacterium]
MQNVNSSPSATGSKFAGLAALVVALVAGLFIGSGLNLSSLSASIIPSDGGQLEVELVDGDGDGFNDSVIVTCNSPDGCNYFTYSIYDDAQKVIIEEKDCGGATTCQFGPTALDFATHRSVYAAVQYGDPALFKMDEITVTDLNIDECPLDPSTINNGCPDTTAPSVAVVGNDTDGDGLDETFEVTCSDAESGCATVGYDFYKPGKRGTWTYVSSGQATCTPAGDCSTSAVSVSSYKSYRVEASGTNGEGLSSSATYEGSGDSCPDDPDNACSKGGGKPRK